MPKWARPYGHDQDDFYTLRYAVAGVMTVGGLVPFFCGFAVGDMDLVLLPVALVCYAIWVVFVWRLARVGVYVSESGVKICHVMRSRMIPWSRVTRAWAGDAADFDAWQIWVSTRDPERDFETPLWRQGSRTQHRNRVRLAPDQFAAVLQTLNSRS